MRFFRPAPARVTLVNADEAAALAQLYGRAWTDCDATIDRRLVEDQRASLEEVRAWLVGGFELYKTTRDGMLVGAVRCSFPSSTCHVDRLAVDPELRRRGYGHSLVSHAVGRARRAGVSRVWVELSPKLTEALSLFRHQGFREAGRYNAGYWGEPVTLLELPL
jgi:ribosomal protein S18 acetylase RimI-like enzyme